MSKNCINIKSAEDAFDVKPSVSLEEAQIKGNDFITVSVPNKMLKKGFLTKMPNAPRQVHPFEKEFLLCDRFVYLKISQHTIRIYHAEVKEENDPANGKKRKVNTKIRLQEFSKTQDKKIDELYKEVLQEVLKLTVLN